MRGAVIINVLLPLRSIRGVGKKKNGEINKAESEIASNGRQAISIFRNTTRQKTNGLFCCSQMASRLAASEFMAAPSCVAFFSAATCSSIVYVWKHDKSSLTCSANLASVGAWAMALTLKIRSSSGPQRPVEVGEPKAARLKRALLLKIGRSMTSIHQVHDGTNYTSEEKLGKGKKASAAVLQLQRTCLLYTLPIGSQIGRCCFRISSNWLSAKR